MVGVVTRHESEFSVLFYFPIYNLTKNLNPLIFTSSPMLAYSNVLINIKYSSIKKIYPNHSNHIFYIIERRDMKKILIWEKANYFF